MAISNLGMGLSGFGIERPTSQVVQSPEEYANQYKSWLQQAQQGVADQQNAYGGLMQQSQLQNQASNALVKSYTDAGSNPSNIDGAFTLQAMSNNGIGAGWSDAARSAVDAALPGYNSNIGSDLQTIQQQIAQAKRALSTGQQNWQTQHDQYVNNQAAGQQAYNLANGGGFVGGILNSSYSNPFSNTVTGSANPAASANAASAFSGGLMGQGGAPAAPSTGLNPTAPTYTNPWAAQPAQAPQQGASGWGGPFSAKNPWSLS